MKYRYWIKVECMRMSWQVIRLLIFAQHVSTKLGAHQLWVFGNAEEKRKVVQLAFGRQLAYCRNEGFRTVSPSLPFQIIQGLSGKLGNDNDLESVMVRPRR